VWKKSLLVVENLLIEKIIVWIKKIKKHKEVKY